MKKKSVHFFIATLVICCICDVTNSYPKYPECVPGTFHPDPMSCSSYFECVHGQLMRRPCGPGTNWNQGLLTCDWPQNARCQIPPYRQPQPDPYLYQTGVRVPPYPQLQPNPYHTGVQGPPYPQPQPNPYRTGVQGLPYPQPEPTPYQGGIDVRSYPQPQPNSYQPGFQYPHLQSNQTKAAQHFQY